MHVNRERHASDVAPMFNVHPEPPRTTGATLQSSAAAARGLGRMRTIVHPSATALPSNNISNNNNDVVTTAAVTRAETTHSSSDSNVQSPTKVVLFSSAARSVISKRKLQPQPPTRIPEDSAANADTDELRDATIATIAATTTINNNNAIAHDPWAAVLTKVARKSAAAPTPTYAANSRSSRISLVRVLKSSGVKSLVQQAVATQRHARRTIAATASAAATTQLTGGSSVPTAKPSRSAVMEHWVKTAMLRHQTDVDYPDDDVAATTNAVNDSDDDDAAAGIESGFDVRATSRSRHMYGRTLLLEESCRRAFAQRGESRSPLDLQALKAWFQLTKLKITTDFDRIQSTELDLLCRRMVLATFHANEVVFRQGDDGDALFLVFAGVVEVRVSQRVLGEKVEVTVCELTKGDYFGERALLHNEMRAATVVAKTKTDLVRISRADYNLMLKTDQLAFLSRLQMANGLAAAAPTTMSTALQAERAYVRVLTKSKTARTKRDLDMLSAYLATLKFFRALPKTFVRELCSVVDSLAVPAGATVFREGDIGDLFYIVFSGSVDVVVATRDARGHTQPTKLIHLTEGAHFGELALMKGSGIRSATVVAREPCRFLVICEKDYNATLRRMQKADLAKRVSVLDRIAVFQTPEWTGELLKELSYVLAEQRVAAGKTLFTQGDKALHVYIVVRGELAVTKDIADPSRRDVRHTVLVGRVGQYRVVGDDAAAGASFNDILFREVTATATTPVEVLVLSKYDVFHRLSRTAREALRAAAHAHDESVIDLDRFHKTDKWVAYKQRVLREHVNHERLAKLLPVHTPRGGHATTAAAVEARSAETSSQSQPQSVQSHSQFKTKPRKTSKTKKPKLPLQAPRDDPPDEQSMQLDHELEHVSHPDAPSSSVATGSATILTKAITTSALATPHQNLLVSANEFMLLPPHDAAAMRTRASTHTIGHFVATFNADAPPSAARHKQLADVLRAEERRRVHTLNEGNPFTYLDVDAVKQQETKHHVEVRDRAASTRRTLLLGAESPTATLSTMASFVPNTSRFDALAAQAAQHDALVDRVATNVLNQLGPDNFVFARPVRHVEGSGSSALVLPGSHQHRSNGCANTDADDGAQTAAAAAQRTEVEQLCDGDLVVMCVEAPDAVSYAADDRTVRSLQSPIIQIVGAVHSLAQARELVLREQIKAAQVQLASASTITSSSNGSELAERPAPAVAPAPPLAVPPATSYFLLPKRKYGVLPRAERSRAAEELLQRELVDRYARTATAPSGSSSAGAAPMRRPSVASLPSRRSTDTTTFPERTVLTVPAPSSSPPAASLEPSGLFASFQQIVLTTSELHDFATRTATPLPSTLSVTAGTATGTTEPHSSRLFAVVSVILSRREIANAVCDEPLVCVHALCASEAQAAIDAALPATAPSHFCNAMLCVLPVGERVHFEDAYNWCVQVEPDRREKRSGSTLEATLSPNRTRVPAPVLSSSPSSSPSRMATRLTSRKAIGIGSSSSSPLRIMTTATAAPDAPEWHIERENARRLHQFICSRLGQKAAAADRDRREQQETSGFTPRSLLALDDKLATLHEYLESAHAAGTRTGGSHNSRSNALSKYRQMKRFGSIMRARIGSTLAPSGFSPSPLVNGNGSGPTVPLPSPGLNSPALSLAAAAVSAMAANASSSAASTKDHGA